MTALGGVAFGMVQFDFVDNQQQGTDQGSTKW